MASGIWRRLTGPGMLGAAIVLDTLNIIPFEPLDLIITILQYDYVSDLRGMSTDLLSVILGLEAALPVPFDITPVCLLTYLRTRDTLMDIPPDTDVIDVEYTVREEGADNVDDEDR